MLHVFGIVFGSGFGGWIADKWGKKRTMFTFNLLAYACWLTSSFARNRYLLYSTYSLQGFFRAIAYNCTGTWMKYPIYVNSFPQIKITSMHIFQEYILPR